MIIGFHYRRSLTRRASRGAPPEGRPRRPTARAADAGAWRAPRVGDAELPAAAEEAESAPAVGSVAAAMVARQRLVAAGHLEPSTGKPLLVEELRPIAGALRARAFAPNAGRRDRLILVSGADRGEAASFVAVDLALALSQDGQAVLLVDADPQAMGSAGAFGLPPEPGLSDALEHGGDLNDFVLPTGLDDLCLMPPGSASPRMAELIASRRMARLLRELLAGAPQRLVLIDAPPLLAGTTGAALAMFAGQVVLMAVAGRTSEQAIEHSLRRLDRRDNLSFVLSRRCPPAARRDQAAHGRRR